MGATFGATTFKAITFRKDKLKLHMKKLLIVSSFFFGILGAADAQTKIGYINPDELVASMPEASKADAELKEYQESLQLTGQEKFKKLQVEDSLFVKDSAKLSPSMKEIRRNELVKLYQEVQNWQQESQEMYQAKAQEKIAPIRNKAMDAIKTVAKENGYSYVLDINTVIVAPPGDDLLPLVKKKLGIKDTPPATPRPAATPVKQ